MILESGKTTLILVVLILALLIMAAGRLKSFSVPGSDPAKMAEEKNVGSDPAAALSEQDRDFSKNGTAMVLFGGDMMFDRYIRQVVERRGFDHVLGDLKGVLRRVDFVVANLEGPITDSESKSVGSEFGTRENYIFTFPEETANDLYRNNISVVSIGNNHILNFGQKGLGQTRQALKEANVRYFGDPEDPDYSGYIKEFNGVEIAFVGHNEFAKNGSAAVLDEIAEMEKKAVATVVYAHWGNEFEKRSNQKQRDLAHQFIDAGADLVIGSHPHVVQEIETYKGKRIYYSLGNFVFDQYFQEETKKGLMVEVVFESGKEPEFKEMEISLSSDGKTSLAKK